MREILTRLMHEVSEVAKDEGNLVNKSKEGLR